VINPRHGHVDAIFASIFLFTLGGLLWPTFFANPLRAGLVGVTCFSCTGDEGWKERLWWVTVIAFSALWLFGSRCWSTGVAVPSMLDHTLFCTLLIAMSVWALRHPLPTTARAE